jgi:hypothetical protein
MDVIVASEFNDPFPGLLEQGKLLIRCCTGYALAAAVAVGARSTLYFRYQLSSDIAKVRVKMPDDPGAYHLIIEYAAAMSLWK